MIARAAARKFSRGIGTLAMQFAHRGAHDDYNLNHQVADDAASMAARLASQA